MQLPALSGLQVAALNRPARIVSGDVYDVVAVTESHGGSARTSAEGLRRCAARRRGAVVLSAMLQAASVVESALAAETMSISSGSSGRCRHRSSPSKNTTACRQLDLSGRAPRSSSEN